MVKRIPKAGLSLAKIAVGGVILVGLGAMTISYAQAKPLAVAEKVELDRYLGVWYEIARKPLHFQKKCDHDITAIYTLNENGNVVIENRCYSKNGTLNQAMGEAFIENPPFNSKLKVSFLPEGIRWLPVGRGDYWILKIDEDYQTVLIDEPERKYMWVLSRTAHPDEAVIQHYLDYAKTLGYRLNDVIRSKHRKQ